MLTQQVGRSSNRQLLTTVSFADKMGLLREGYDAARIRAGELRFSGSGNSMPIAVRIHSQVAGKVYSALSTMLYASICSAKSEHLERYVLTLP